MIEKATRRHLRVDQLHSLQDVDLYTVVSDDLINDFNILEVWENIFKPSSRRYNTYSIELLKLVSRLWITVKDVTLYYATHLSEELEKLSVQREQKKKHKLR